MVRVRRRFERQLAESRRVDRHSLRMCHNSHDTANGVPSATMACSSSPIAGHSVTPAEIVSSHNESNLMPEPFHSVAFQTPADQASEVQRLLADLKDRLTQHLPGRVQDPLARAIAASRELVTGINGINFVR